MSILSILPAAGTAATTATTSLSPAYGMTADQRRQSFHQLAAALQSGDLSGAQTAYANLMTGSAASTSSVTSGTSALPWWMKNSSTLTQDFQTLGNDLSSGNLSGAQADFTHFQTDAKAAFSQMQADGGGASGLQGHHRHHHHHQPQPQQDSATASAAQTTTTAPTATNPLLSLLSSASLSGFSNSLASAGGGLAAPFSLFS